jgi:hypothetical protein
MANKTTLKGYFEIGDIPSQAQYADLIDSNLNLQETGTQILVGTLSASFLEVQNHITSSGNISASGYLVAQNITASGNISASGYLVAQNITASSNISASGYLVAQNITASGNISASYTSTGSFGSLRLTNLPTTKPTTTGSLWLSGSADDGTSKYLLVFTG